MMNHFNEANNQSYNFIAPLGAVLFCTYTKNKNNAGVTRFINLFRIV